MVCFVLANNDWLDHFVSLESLVGHKVNHNIEVMLHVMNVKLPVMMLSYNQQDMDKDRLVVPMPFDQLNFFKKTLKT